MILKASTMESVSFLKEGGRGGGAQGVLCKNSLLADLFGSQHLLEI